MLSEIGVALRRDPESALEGALFVTVVHHRERERESLESALGSTPESTPISESTLESTWEHPDLGHPGWLTESQPLQKTVRRTLNGSY